MSTSDMAERDDWNSLWSEYGESSARNPAQFYRRRLVLKLLAANGTKPERLIDLGSGTGELLQDVLTRWPSVEALGLEPSAIGVKISRRREPKARFEVYNVLTDPEPEGNDARWATHVTCTEVLEHVDDPVALLRNARPWFAPGCKVVITVPGGPMSAFDRHIGHRRHYNPAAITEVIKSAGLVPLHAYAAGFPFHNLYRALIIARGRRLATDVARPSAGEGAAPLPVRIGLAVFEPLFRLNLLSSPFGWQTVAIAEEPRS